MRNLTYRAAIREAMWESMQADESVFILGEDVEYGGVYAVTRGFLDEFGPDRIVDTPIAETAIIGAAQGAALVGMRPIAEIQFADFITPALDLLANMTAKYHYRTRQPIPMVIRAPSGSIVTAHGSTGPFHSQCPEAWYAHTPGIKVVLPANPYDAKGLLHASIDDPNPVLFLEQKGLYNLKSDVPEGKYVVPLGQANIVRSGDDISVITYGAMVPMALEAADRMAQEGVSVEIVDLRTIVPLDKEAILESVRKTGKCVIAHEATLTAGFGAELSAIIAEEAFEYLDGPIRRVAAADTPIPAAPQLADFVLPNVDKLTATIRDLVAF
ncbi:MAG: pyruvate/2-oxoglutarate/acetoin dehydrogenase E1 component [Cellvibrionaceae bacterium]|jgi:pyruvate/2-oxoglutarate/acetoin dehydrogenase E1 component